MSSAMAVSTAHDAALPGVALRDPDKTLRRGMVTKQMLNPFPYFSLSVRISCLSGRAYIPIAQIDVEPVPVLDVKPVPAPGVEW